MDWLRPRFEVRVNGERCEVMEVRKKQQQSTRRGFAVNLPTQAHNIEGDAGALVFDCSAFLKVLVPEGMDHVDSLSVYAEFKEIQKRKERCKRGGRGGEGIGGSEAASRGGGRVDGERKRRMVEVIRMTEWESLGQNDQMEFRKGSRRNSSAVVLENEGKALVVMINLHHRDTLAAAGMLPLSQAPVCDDVDSRHGLHGYTCVVTLRSFGSVLWQGVYRDVISRELCKDKGYRFPVLSENQSGQDITTQIQLSSQLRQIGSLGVYYRSPCFSGVLKDMVVVDFALWDAFGNVPVGFSTPLRLQASMPGFGEGEAWIIEKQVDDNCSIRLNVSKKQTDAFEDEDASFHVRSLEFWLKKRLIQSLYPRE